MTFKHVDGLSLWNTGHNLQVDGPLNDNLGYLALGEVKYFARQFHLHFPSEHRFDGYNLDAELHIVHQRENATGNDGLLVIAILYKEGEENVFLNDIGFDGELPHPHSNKKDSEAPIGRTIDVAESHVQLAGPFFHYVGSLTTPPCTEGVKWFVVEEVATVSVSQMRQFEARYPRNNRPTQPTNGRCVDEGGLSDPPDTCVMHARRATRDQGGKEEEGGEKEKAGDDSNSSSSSVSAGAVVAICAGGIVFIDVTVFTVLLLRGRRDRAMQPTLQQFVEDPQFLTDATAATQRLSAHYSGLRPQGAVYKEPPPMCVA